MDLQANYATSPNPLLLWVNEGIDPIEGYHFFPHQIEREEIPAYNPHEIKINGFIDWMCDKWECTWYASVCHFFTVCISDTENSWEICCKGDREAGGFFPRGTDLAAKKQYVQKQFSMVLAKMNQ